MALNPYNLKSENLKGRIPEHSGELVFVSSARGNTNGDGTLHRPFSTIEAAFNKSGLSAGDIIVVAEGHTETVTAAAGIDADVAGVTVLGLGTGNNRPLITLSTVTTADIDIDAANIRFENIRFDLTGVDALAAPIDVNSSGFQLVNCELELADSGGQCTVAVLTDANASDMLVERCYFFGSGDAGTETAIRIVGGDSIFIRHNIIVGAFTTTRGGIENVTTACTNCFVKDNYIDNRTASSTKAMVFVAGSTGRIADNRLQILSGTAPITGAGMSWVGGNYYAAVVATTGTLI